MSRWTRWKRWINRNNLRVEELYRESLADVTIVVKVESYYSLWRSRPIVTRVWTEFEQALGVSS